MMIKRQKDLCQKIEGKTNSRANYRLSGTRFVEWKSLTYGVTM